MKIDQAQQKLLNYLDDFMDSDYFQESIIALRKEFKIPKNGFKLSKKIKNKLVIDANISDFSHIPKALQNKTQDAIKSINLSLENTVIKFPINDTTIRFLFKLYLFYNVKIYDTLSGGLDTISLCRIEDLKDNLNEFCILMNAHQIINALKQRFKDYPIVLKLHPSISQRDLLSYIKTHWEIIHFYLSLHKSEKSKLGKLRTKSEFIKQRNEFIYKHRNLPYKDLVIEVGKRFPYRTKDTVDEGGVGKIISLEKKRRKQV